MNQIWDATRVELLHEFPINGFQGTKTMAFSPSGRFLASNTFRGTFVWDTETGKEVNLIKTGWADFEVLLFTRDEKQILMIPPFQEKVVFWDIETGEPVREINHPGPLVNFGDSFLQARDAQDAIEIFDIRTQTRLSRIQKLEHLPLNQQFFHRVRFHPSGNILAVSYRDRSEQKHRFYDSHTGRQLAVIPGRDFRFAGDGKFMFLENLNYELELYRTGEILNVAPVIAVQPHGRKFVTFGQIKQNRLLQNYPNPFNPETWIPYQLAAESDVTITIYSTQGQRVRTLDIGRQKSGVYRDKANAAYWDDRNNMGEAVGSGVYFCTLEAGDYRTTRQLTVAR